MIHPLDRLRHPHHALLDDPDGASIVVRAIAARCGGILDTIDPPTCADPAFHGALALMIRMRKSANTHASKAEIAPDGRERAHPAAPIGRSTGPHRCSAAHARHAARLHRLDADALQDDGASGDRLACAIGAAHVWDESARRSSVADDADAETAPPIVDRSVRFGITGYPPRARRRPFFAVRDPASGTRSTPLRSSDGDRRRMRPTYRATVDRGDGARRFWRGRRSIPRRCMPSGDMRTTHPPCAQRSFSSRRLHVKPVIGARNKPLTDHRLQATADRSSS